jgi:ATP-dependent Clp protease ATP-binding subunit ClpA
MNEEERVRALRAAMGEYRAHLRELDHFAGLARQEAERLRSTVIGPDEFLLALLHPDVGDSLAAQALRDCGVTREAVEELARPHQWEEEIPDGPQYNPAGLHLQYMAEGIAAGRGDTEVGAEHLLLAYLWEPDHSASELEQLGTSREQVRRQLEDLGVDLPQAELPARDPRRYGPEVDVPLDDLWILIRELSYVLPAEASFSFNHDWKNGWVALTEGLDAQEYIERALERHRRVNLPPEEAG